MKIYIDNDYKCHVSPGEGLREFNVPFFDGKCQTVIEGYRYIPPGERWVKPNGVILRGEQITPWKDSRELERVQMEYELQQYEVALSAIEKALGVTS